MKNAGAPQQSVLLPKKRMFCELDWGTFLDDKIIEFDPLLDLTVELPDFEYDLDEANKEGQLDCWESKYPTQKQISQGPDPIRMEDGYPVYDSRQIEVHGRPEYWGVENYRVISLRETEHPMVTDWKMEQERGRMRPIHRYSRVERFTSILAQLIACRGKVPKEIIVKIKQVGYPQDPDLVWNAIRKILKDMKGRRYYNRIPTILEMLGFPKSKNGIDQNSLMREIINDFKIVSSRFDRVKKELGRVYFPSLRFVAFKLLELYGIEFGYTIPFIRTPRKLKAMEQTWALLI